MIGDLKTKGTKKKAVEKKKILQDTGLGDIEEYPTSSDYSFGFGTLSIVQHVITFEEFQAKEFPKPIVMREGFLSNFKFFVFFAHI